MPKPPEDMNRPYWNMKMETMLNTPEMRKLQLRKLKKRIAHLKEVSPFWKEELKDANPEKIKSFKDFAKAVPIFDKQKFRDLAFKYAMDIDEILKQLMGKEYDDLRVIAATSGTTGEPTPYPLTKADLTMWAEANARMGWRCGIRPGQKVLQAFGLSMFLAGVPMVMALAEYGCKVLPVGAEAGSERILFYARFFKPDALCTTPSLAGYIVDKSVDILGEGELKNLGIRTVLCGGEPGAGIPEIRKKIEEGFGAKLFDGGAGLGCSCDYPVYQGMHSIGDDVAITELVDPDTQEPVPWEDGAIGMAVFTPLVGAAMAGVRQTLGDMQQITVSPCPCGKTGFRYKVVGRTDDMLKVKGVMIYPPAVADVIAKFEPKVTGQFRIVLDEPPPRVVPPLKVKIEYGKEMPVDQLPALAKEMEDRFHSAIKIRPQIIWVEPDSLPRPSQKQVMIEKAWLNKK